jgi:hypothetical protein
MDALIKAFRGGAVSEDKLRAIEEDVYKAFRLDQTVRPSLLKYVLPIDEALVRSVCKRLETSERSLRRLGRDWLEDSLKIQPKDNRDDLWCSPDDLKPLNDVCTRWCTTNYFPSAESRVNMIANLTRVFETVGLHSSTKFDLVFKGGVMIRFLIREFARTLSIDSCVRLLKYMTEHRATSMSDLDFEVVPRNHDLSARQTYRGILLNYAMLLWFQARLEREVRSQRNDGILTTGWDVDAALVDLRTRLQETVREVDASSAFHGATIDAVTIPGRPAPRLRHTYRTRSGKTAARPRRNVAIFSCDDTKCVLSATDLMEALDLRGVPTQRRTDDVLYATMNTHIGEGDAVGRADHLTSQFHLCRIKHTFTVYYTTKTGERRIDRLGGEMIDLSQSHGTSADSKRAHLYRRAAHPYRTYPILGVTTPIRSYSVEGFLEDHCLLLYHNEEQPWDANKIEKRLLRYAIFVVMRVMELDLSTRRKHGLLERLVDSTSSVEQLRHASGTDGVDHHVLRMLQRTVLAAPHGHARRAAAFLKSLHAHLAECVRAVVTPHTWNTRVVFEAALWHTDHTKQHTGKKYHH